MKKILSILSAGLVALTTVVSCVEEPKAIFDTSKATPPELLSYELTDDALFIDYKPADFGQDFNQKMPVNYSVILKSLGGAPTTGTINSSIKNGQIVISVANLSKAIMGMGFVEGTKINVELGLRASIQETARDNGRNGFVESLGTIMIPSYEVYIPTGDPYGRYTEKSSWGLVGSFNGWGAEPDVEMWTNGTLILAKAVQLSAGTEVKFRKHNSWDENLGYADGIDSYTLGEEFALAPGGGNIVIKEDGLYDILVDVIGQKAKIIESVAEQEDPYAAYTEKSPWSVIGSFNSWGGDVEMVTNGTLHLCKNITFTAGTEFKFRKDAGWGTNFGYAEGIDYYVLGEEFSVGQDGANIVIKEDGAYDLFLDPENATAKIIKTQAVVIDPYAKYTETSLWSVIGSFNSWGGDVEMVTNGTLHVCKAIAFTADTEWKFRYEGGWTVNFGYAEGVDSYTLGEEFALGQDGANIKIKEDGVYDLILDPENATAKIIESVAVEQPEPPAPEEKPAMWSIIGTIDGSNWDKDFDMSNTSGDVWMIRSIALTADSEFKIRADHDWGKSVGGPEDNNEGTYKPEIGKVFDAGDKNIKVGVEGVYDVTFDYAAKTILIEEHIAAYSLIGMINGSEWNKDFLMTEKDGVWTSEVVKIAGGFKIRYDYSWADENTYGAEPDFEVVPGTPFTAVQPGSDIKLAEGDYKVQFTPATKEVIIKSVLFPEQVYMVGTDFGGWDWNSDGVVELTPVLHNPDWGANAEAQYWTVRYLTAGNGVKFNSARAWDGGQFGSLETNEGFTNDKDGNVVVAESGLYMIHIDFKRSILHVEPARIYAVGATVGDGSWVEEAEAGLFKNDGAKTSFTADRGGELRMYAASAISTSACWTREFIVLNGKIEYRGTGGDQQRVSVLAGQKVTLDFNAGTGSITGEGEAPAYKPEITVAGSYSGNGWSPENDPKLAGDGEGVYRGALVMIGGEFKFVHDGSWIGGTATDLLYELGADSNMTIADGTYFWTVSLPDNLAVALPVTKVGLIGSFNEWSEDVEMVFDETDNTYNAEVTLEAEAQVKVRFNGNWDYCLGGTLEKLSAFGGNVYVAEAGTYNAKLDLNKGTLTLTK